MQPLLNIAVGAARLAGNSLLRNLKRLERLSIQRKGTNDFVSEADVQAEQAIIEHIHKHHPDHAILAEESGISGDSEHVWIIDPLDGTTNFLHGFPVFCVSIALRSHGRLEHAVVYDPLREELFTASRGIGAQLDGRKIRVSSTLKLDEALIGTGFPYRDGGIEPDVYMKQFRKIQGAVAGVRRPGAAALDLAYVAAGRLDGFWEHNLQPWDIAAGALLIREAGGIISGIDGGENFLETGDVLTANRKIYAEMAGLIGRSKGQR